MRDNINNPIDLPEILQAEWGADQVHQLFDDLRDGARVEHVQLRTAEQDFRTSLEEGRQAFVNQTAHAIQVRYRFENELWCDTIMPGEPTTKIVRTRLME